MRNKTFLLLGLLLGLSLGLLLLPATSSAQYAKMISVSPALSLFNIRLQAHFNGGIAEDVDVAMTDVELLWVTWWNQQHVK